MALEQGQVAFEGTPADFCAWAPTQAPALATNASVCFAPHGAADQAVTVRAARAALGQRGVLPPEPAGAAASSASPAPRPTRRARATQALSVRGLWREVSGGAALLRGIDLQVAPGEAVAIMGATAPVIDAPAGARRPGSPGARAGARGRARGAAPAAAPETTCSMSAWLTSFGRAWIWRRRVWTGIPNLLSRHPSTLSGGERQRLAALVVAGQESPAVLCLDEPTRGLDRRARHALSRQLAALRAQGTATIVATHDRSSR